jgi:Gly-Xaa carboxypeptidase
VLLISYGETPQVIPGSLDLSILNCSNHLIMKTFALLGLAAVPSLALNIPTQQFLSGNLLGNDFNPLAESSARETCPQPPKASTPSDGLHSSQTFLSDQAFRARQAERLSRAVQIPTTVGDFATDPYDDAFEPVVKFQELLEELFPLV